jgi:hypothetical protein
MELEENDNQDHKCMCLSIFGISHLNNDDLVEKKEEFLKFVEKNIYQFPPCLSKFSWIIYLTCDFNNIHEINVLPPLLESFSCCHNKIKELNHTVIPKSLKNLYMHSNYLEQLDISMTNIEILGCHYNSLKSLRINEGLQTLLINHNYLSKIEFNGNQILSHLSCGNCILDDISYFPDSILILYVYGNNLKRINKLPSRLQYLNCVNNRISHISHFPDTLIELVISKNNFTKLVCDAQNLQILYCTCNSLKELHVFTSQTLKLICHDNPLELIDIKSPHCCIEYNLIETNTELVFCQLECLNNNYSQKLNSQIFENLLANTFNYKKLIK